MAVLYLTIGLAIFAVFTRLQVQELRRRVKRLELAGPLLTIRRET